MNSKCSQTFGILETISYVTPEANMQSCKRKHSSANNSVSKLSWNQTVTYTITYFTTKVS